VNTAPPVSSAICSSTDFERRARALPGGNPAGEGDRVDGDAARADELQALAEARRAARVLPVREQDEHLAPGGILHPREVDGDGVVERGVAAALGVRDALEQALLVLAVVAGEADVVVEEDGHEVARARDRLQEAHGGLLRELELLEHARAGVHEQAEVEGERVLLARLHRAAEELDALGAAVLEHREVVGREVGDEAAGGVADGDGEVDLFELAGKDRLRAPGGPPPATPRRRGGPPARARRSGNSRKSGWVGPAYWGPRPRRDSNP
jgi:hypothetical protein